MASPRDQEPDLALRCAAYAVLRQSQPQLPPLDLPQGDGVPTARDGVPAARALSMCFAAARQLLADTPQEEALFGDLNLPSALPPELALRVHAVVARTEATLSMDAAADPLGPLFEATSSSAARKNQGQHFTPLPVVALVLALARAKAAANVMDPTCGTGAFLTRAAAGSGAATLWGCELDPLAARLARINLRGRPGGSPVHIHTGDVLALQPGDPVQGHPLPRCDAVVGNLPYVRLHRQTMARWRQDLGQRWATRDPALVTRGEGGEPTLRLSGHADLYALLFFHLADLVTPGGRLALLTANAYLDAGYGKILEQFFLRHFHVVAVVESRCEPWFADASVNTVITVLERRGGVDTPADRRVRFVQLTRPLLAQPDNADNAEPVDPIDLARTIESAAGSGPQAEAGTTTDHPLPYVSIENPACRIRLVDPRRLETTPGDPAQGDPWSAYLRAPDIYFRLRRHRALRPVGSLITLRRGVTTNWNAFFYPPATAAVEDDYLVPVVRSPRVSRTISVQRDQLDTHLFVCNASQADLRRAGHRGALDWIGHGLQMTNRQGRPIRETLKTSPWYSLNPVRYRLLLTKTTHDTHLHRLVDGPTAVDQRLYGVTPPDPADTELVAGLLNSSLVALMTEVVGSASLGDGALDLPVTTARERLLMPDPAALSPAARQRILDAFGRLAHRPVLPIWREVRQPDRQALDKAVLTGLDLDAEATLPPLYEGLCTLTRERLTLATLRRTLHRR
jgi:methylase of polypeptide subunit release factors